MNRGHYADAYALLHTDMLPDAKTWERFCAAQRSEFGRSRHWEFVAIALLHRFGEAETLAQVVRDRLTAMRPFWHIRHESMNFRLMRAVADAWLDRRPFTAHDLSVIGLIPRADGALPDGREGISTQYHAYMLLLLLRWGDRQDAVLCRIVEKGFGWLHSIWRCYGEPNPLGRGRFQLFGYGALAAACHYAGNWSITHPEGYIAHVHDRLDPELPDGALSARWTGPFRDVLLHGYNTPDDYRAFATFWTVDIPRTAANAVPDALVRYPLDFSGSCLIANGQGPLAAITTAPLKPPEDNGRIQGLREGLRNVRRKPRYAENLFPEPLTQSGFRFGAMHFHCNGETLTMEVQDAPFQQSPVIWTLERMPVPKTEGVMEMAVWNWSRPGGPVWRGHSYRIFGRARLRWALR